MLGLAAVVMLLGWREGSFEWGEWGLTRQGFTSKPWSAKRSPPVTVNAPVMITRAGAVCQGMVLCGKRAEWMTGGGEKGGGGQIRAEYPVVGPTQLCVCVGSL